MLEKKESQRETLEARRQAISTVFQPETDSHKYANRFKIKGRWLAAGKRMTFLLVALGKLDNYIGKN